MQNVMTFKTTRNQNTTGTALIRVEDMSPREAFLMHTSIKERGRGAVKQFVEHETPYTGYSQYHYQMKKLGVMPFNKRSNSVSVENTRVAKLEAQIKQLELQLLAAQVTPANRALDILVAAFGELTFRSRNFLCSIISKDPVSLSQKQEKWLSDLESKHL